MNPRESANNRKSNRRITFNGNTHTVAEWSRLTEIPYNALDWRLCHDWPIEKALTTPAREKKLITYDGKTMTVDQWEKETGIHRCTLRNRIERGLPLEEVFKKENLNHANQHGDWVYLELNGKRQTIPQWAKELEVDPSTIRQRIKKGWPIEKVLAKKHVPKYRKKDYLKEFQTFYSMTQRCNNKTNKRYDCYGGRGFKNEFDDVTQFIDEVGRAPSPESQIERIDNDKGYLPAIKNDGKRQCVWATPVEQANNRRTSTEITYQGNTHTIAEWSKLTGIPYPRLFYRIKQGWPLEKVCRYWFSQLDPNFFSLCRRRPQNKKV